MSLTDGNDSLFGLVVITFVPFIARLLLGALLQRKKGSVEYTAGLLIYGANLLLAAAH